MGWTYEDVTRLGWMRPSAVIANQTVPPGGFPAPSAGLWEKWRSDLLLFGFIALGAVGGFAISIVKRKPFLLVANGTVLLLACVFVLSREGPAIAVRSFAIVAILFIATGVLCHLKGARADRPRVEGPAIIGHDTPGEQD